MSEENDPVDPLPEAVNVHAIGQNGHLAGIVEMLASADSVRTELVDDIREQINNGTYLSDEKLNLAIYRLLKDILD